MCASLHGTMGSTTSTVRKQIFRKACEPCESGSEVRDDDDAVSTGSDSERVDSGWPRRGPGRYRSLDGRHVIIKCVAELMRGRKLTIDDATSKADEGIMVSQPYTFIKGAVVSQLELYRYARVESAVARGGTRGLYTITVEVQPIVGTC